MNVCASAVFLRDTERDIAAVVSAVVYSMPSHRACVFSQLNVDGTEATLMLPDLYPCLCVYETANAFFVGCTGTAWSCIPILVQSLIENTQNILKTLSESQRVVDAAAIVNRLYQKNRTKKIFLCGHSLGGAVAHAVLPQLSQYRLESARVHAVLFNPPAFQILKSGKWYAPPSPAWNSSIKTYQMQGDPVSARGALWNATLLPPVESGYLGPHSISNFLPAHARPAVARLQALNVSANEKEQHLLTKIKGLRTERDAACLLACVAASDFKPTVGVNTALSSPEFLVFDLKSEWPLFVAFCVPFIGRQVVDETGGDFVKTNTPFWADTSFSSDRPLAFCGCLGATAVATAYAERYASLPLSLFTFSLDLDRKQIPINVLLSVSTIPPDVLYAFSAILPDTEWQSLFETAKKQAEDIVVEGRNLVYATLINLLLKIPATLSGI